MKKLNLLVVSALMALGLTACGGDPAESTSSPETPTTSETTSEAPVVDYAALAAEAFGYVSAPYDAFSNGIGADQDLAPTCTAQNVTFQIRYTVSAAAAAHLALSAEGDKLLVTQDMEEHAYVKALKAEVLHEGTVVLTKEYNVKVGKLASIASLYSAADGTIVTTVGKVVRVRSDGNGFHMADGDHAIYVYRGTLPEGCKVGDTVKVAGELDIYNGLYELKNVKVEATDFKVTDPEPVEMRTITNTGDATLASREAVYTKGFLHAITGSKKTASSGGDYLCVEATVVTDDAQTITVRAEDRKMSKEDFASWGLTTDDKGNYVFTNKDLKRGAAVTVTGFVDFYNGKVQIGAPVLKAVETFQGTVPSKPEPEVKTKTVGELLELGDKTITTEIYEVSGVLENKADDNKFGGAYLTDPVSKKTIQIYGSTKTASALAWNGIDAYTFSNPKDAVTSLADVKNGQLVTMKAMYAPFNGTKQINGVILTNVNSDATYTAEVVANDTCDVTLSKTEGITYGEEITITATPKTEGHVVTEVTVTDAQGVVTKVDTKTMKFNAKAVNKVSVICGEKGPVVDATFDIVDLGVPSKDYSAVTETEIDGLGTVHSQGVYNGGSGIQMNKGKNSMIFNTTAADRAIASIKIDFLADKFGNYPTNINNVLVETGSAAFSATTALDKTKSISYQDGVFSYTIPVRNAGDTFFRIAHSNAQGAIYIDSVTVTLVPVTPAA